MQTDGVHFICCTCMYIYIDVCVNTVLMHELYGMISCIAVWFSRGDSACESIEVGECYVVLSETTCIYILYL